MTDDLSLTFEIREQASAQPMTFTGIAVPWGVVITLADGSREQFVRGAIPDIAPESPLPLLWSHDSKSMPVGTITRGTDTDTGYEIACRLADTTAGREAYALLKDGALRGLSIGFKPVATANRNGINVQTSVLLREVSLCNFPAYGNAQVIEVREADSPNPETQDVEDTKSETNNDERSEKGSINMDENIVTEIRSEIEDLGRQVALLGTPANTPDEAPAVLTRSFGEAARGLVTGELDAGEFNRAVDSTLSLTGTQANSWVDRALNVVALRRPIMGTITRAALPDTGTSVEFPTYVSSTGTVAAQATEGTALGLIKVTVNTTTAPIKTYGAYSDLSVQSIQRSSNDYLNKVLTAQLVAYATATSGAVATALNAAAGVGTNSVITADNGKAQAYLDVALEASMRTSNSGLIPSVWVVSLADFRKIMKIVDTSGRPVFDIRRDGVNSFGALDTAAIKGVIGSMPIVPVAELAAGTSFIYDPAAINWFENAGAPIKLQDQAISTLSQQFAVYGYGAVGIFDPSAIVKVTIG